jgi:predicted DNA-binding transcriptional regulator YafY
MATNKNAILRYKILDKCFRNTGRRYFIQDLIDECNKVLLEIDPNTKGISRRQIFDDIAFMESEDGWGVELLRIKDNKRAYYRYEDPSFSINNMPLNEVEIKQLQTAVGILSQFKGMPHFEWMQELSLKLNHGIASEQDKEVIIEFDSNQYLKGIEHLGALHNAIYYKKVLRISYQPYESDSPIDFIIHPYYLKQYNNRWFLFGYNPEVNRYDWNLALDRILMIEEITGAYNVNTEIDWQEYFQDMIGVTKPVDIVSEQVVLHFKGKTGKYVESKPLHDSQNDKWIEPGLLRVKLDVVINFELKRLILSYGPDVEVISPEPLKKEIVNILKAAYNQY